MKEAEVARGEPVRLGLEGRYQVVCEVGRGAAAVVYRARDERHERDVAIKVLRPEAASALSVERFEREIRMVARLQHPHILPLHDSGVTSDGRLFYVMPYVEGHSLRDLLGREGPLPVERAVAIARDVADALDYAHAQGLVHRDIKPENILVSRGRAVLADFGLGRALGAASTAPLTESGLAVGTPAYMSPEQLGVGATGGSPDDVDGRADIYSLGCVLFEMLAGRPPFAGPGLQAIYSGHLLHPPPDLGELRPEAPAELRRVVVRTLAKSPADRYATAGELLTALGGAPTPAATPVSWMRSGARLASGMQRLRRLRRTRSARWVAAATVVLGAALALAAFLGPPESDVPFAARDWVLIADFDNVTGDSALDRSVSTALSIALQQSRHVNVVPTSRVRELLPRLRRSPNDPVTEPVARDLAQRTGARVVIVGTVTRVADAYLLNARLVDPASGSQLATETARAGSRGEVMDALDELSRKLRRVLGESRAALREQSTPLPLLTTSSLDALRHYLDGARAFQRGDLVEARVRYEAALAADSEFVRAHVAQGRLAYLQSDRPRGEEHFKKALALLDRVSEQERLGITADIAEARGEYETARIARESFVRKYPDDAGGWGRLGYANLRLRRCPAAIDAYRRAIAIDSASGGYQGLTANAYTNIATCHMILRDYAAAVTAWREAARRDTMVVYGFNNNESYGGALLRLGRFAEAESVFRIMLGANSERAGRGHRSLAQMASLQGKYDSAAWHFRESLRRSLQTAAPLTVMRTHLFLMTVAERRGDRGEARRELERAYQLFRSSYIDPAFLTLLGKALARRGDVRRAREVLDSVARRHNPRAATDRATMAMLRGEVALARGDKKQAVDEAAAAYAADSMAHVHESLARILAASGDLDAAAARYRRLIEHADRAHEAQEYWVQAHYELGRIYEAKRDTAEAARWYSALLDLWKDADPDLPLLHELRARLAQLRPAVAPTRAKT